MRSLASCGLLGCWLLLATACGPADPDNGTGGVGPVSGQGGGGGGAGGAVIAGSGGEGTAGTGGTAGETPAGSGGSDAGHGGDPNAVNAAGFCERLAQVQCAAEDACCDDAVRKHANIEACLSTQRALCDTRIYTDSRTGFDAAAARTFLANYEQRSSACDLDILAWGASAEGLRSVVKGTVAEGGSCAPRDRYDVAAVARCANSAECLADRSSGSFSIPTFTCTTPAPAGGKCWTPLNCEDGWCNCSGTACNPESLNQIGQGICAAPKQVGATCTEPYECATFACSGGQCVESARDIFYCFAGT